MLGTFPIRPFPSGNFPRVFSQVVLPNCAISQIATSLFCSSRGALPLTCSRGRAALGLHYSLRRLGRLNPTVNVHLGSYRLGNCALGMLPLGKLSLGLVTFGKLPNTIHKKNILNYGLIFINDHYNVSTFVSE